MASAPAPAPSSALAPCVLVVEDEPAMTRLLRSVLSAAGYRVFEVATAKDALAQAAGRSPDLVLLDLGLPDIDGLDVVRRLREWLRAPIVVVSARDREQGKIEALDAGADDYVTKPFAAGELLARLRAALRRAARPADGGPSVFSVGDLRVDLERRTVSVGERAVRLTRTEWKLLAVLVRHAGKVVLHRQLLREVWSPAEEQRPHYLRVYVASLRRKLEADPARPRFLVTETGIGYRLKDE